MPFAVRRFAGVVGFSVCALAASRASGQTVPWRIGRWNPDSFGNQRVVVQVPGTPDASVRVVIPWRRRDSDPAAKRWILTDNSNRRIANALALSLTRDSIDVVFQPVAGRGTYYLYYLPYVGTVKSNYPKISYPGPDSIWAAEWAITARRSAATLPRARVAAFEAVDSMSQRWPMEVPATESERAALQDRLTANTPFAVVVEDRSRPVRMRTDVPLIWTARGTGIVLLGPALHDEYYVFQLAVWTPVALDSIAVHYADARGRATRVAASAFSCINTSGVNWLGVAMAPVVKVAAGNIAPLWCGMMIPATGGADTLAVHAVVTAAGGRSVDVPFQVAVGSERVIHHGDDEPWRLSRLRWLNSQLGASGPPTPPYTAVRPIAGGYHILGRDLLVDAVGFPRQLRSFFSRDLALGPTAHPLLAHPLVLQVERSNGQVLPWQGGGVTATKSTTARQSFHAHGTQAGLDLDVHGDLDFDGNLEYHVALIATRTMAVRDVRLEVPIVAGTARYFMGMNLVGARAPASYHWTWDVTHNQDAFWIGDVDGGMQLTFKDEHYVRPLNTNFYQQSPLVMPRSWANDGHGSCTFAAQPGEYLASCGSGARTLAAHDTLWYNFRVLVTPFHPADTKTHFATRYYHAYVPVDTVRAAGANLVNVHHATAINPWLNYPFLRADAMRAYADSLHAAGMRLKIYYTVRELSNRAPEFWALRSLGTEVLAGGPGGGHSWLQEHVVDNYLPGWVVPKLRDVTLVTNGISRWHNYYVEGLQWLTEHAGVDGIYLDDVAFDRATMLRIRRVLAAHGTPGERIDLHSANQYDHNDGFASSANLYMEHFPFIDRLWFGEGFNYDSPPAYWLVEMSGLPFGLMGEMLEGGGNPWRGMLFGMTNRIPWTGGDPRELWKAWDAFGIVDAKMRGWWNPDAPVQTGRQDVLATSYVRANRTLVAVASWARDTTAVTLRINWRALHLDSTRVRITAPAITGFQPARTFRLGEPVPVAPGHGWLIRLDPFDARSRVR
ncbi:MAG TPA: glycoside hydrolase domain-containing protein [Gemmatimonadales bacterium]|jgi:hypothetical protein